MGNTRKGTEIAVVIPTYKARNHILGVVNEIGPEVARIYVVDDCCPDRSGDFVSANCKDDCVSVYDVASVPFRAVHKIHALLDVRTLKHVCVMGNNQNWGSK